MSLCAKGISVSYQKRAILHNLDFVVSRGTTIGLSGLSGVGKTTLARTLCGLIKPDSGFVSCDGRLVGSRRGKFDGSIAMMFQSPRRSTSPRMSLREIIAEPLGRQTIANLDFAEKCAYEVGLSPHLLDRFPIQVSDGQLQLATLARVIAQQPKYLICDEATAMLDTLTTASLVSVLRRHVECGMGVLAISHDRALLTAWADEVATLEGTRGIAFM